MKKKKPVRMKPWTGEVIVMRTGDPDMTTLRKRNLMIVQPDERVAIVQLTEIPKARKR